MAPEKRKEIVDKLLAAVSRFRSCLEIKPDHADARKNIELIRQWLKLYANKWAEIDRNKRRDEMNLFQFVEYLVSNGARAAHRVARRPASTRARTIARS